MLPKIDIPIYELAVPSTKKKIKYRPYLVKEELILLMAAETQNAQDILNATKQIVSNCVIEPERFDVDHLTTFDLDFIFVALRSRSVADEVEATVECNRVDVNGVECKHGQNVKINLQNVQVVRPDGSKKNKIMLSKDYGVEMRFPTFRVLEKVNGLKNDLDKEMKVIEGCIASIFDKEQIYSLESGDSSPAEIRQWIESLTTEQFGKIKSFVESTPYLLLEVKYKCEKCGFDHLIQKRNVLDFF